jgi:serine/threonine protein kinase
LAKGGNACVYEARRGEADDLVALKVLNARRPTSEPYLRFRREVETLRKLGNIPGVLPLLDAHLPEEPTDADPAWLAMPVATPIAVVLSGRSLVEVVQGIAVIARTLASLAELGISHRDIKPGNLYWREGEWLVGDFGLVAAPDVESITRGDRPLGPLHFTPSEVLVGDREVDWSRVDVYALAKTLWVLASDQRYPPDGHQPAGVLGMRLSDYAQHQHASVLDRLIDRATSIAPALRPSMAQMASDLEEWLRLPGDSAAVQVGETVRRIRARLADELALTDQRERWREEFYAAARDLQRLVSPLNDVLREVLGRAEIDRTDDRYAHNVLTTRRGARAPDILATHLRTSRIATGPDYSPFVLSMGRCLELTEDGLLI